MVVKNKNKDSKEEVKNLDKFDQLLKELMEKIDEKYLSPSKAMKTKLDFDVAQDILEFFFKFQDPDYFDSEFLWKVKNERKSFEKKIVELSRKIVFVAPKKETA